MNDMTDEKKIDVMIVQLSERYTALHNMRDRSMQFAVWILGLGFAMAWLLISEAALTPPQSALTLLFLLVIGAASVLFVRGIHVGFENNRSIAARLEEALGLFQAGAYHRALPILNGEFNSKKFRPTAHFFTLYCLMAAVYVFLIALVMINPCAKTKAHQPDGTHTEQTIAK